MALILTHRVKDGPVHLLVGDIEILVDVISIDQGQVRMAYTAPEEVTILRDKVYHEEDTFNAN